MAQWEQESRVTLASITSTPDRKLLATEKLRLVDEVRRLRAEAVKRNGTKLTESRLFDLARHQRHELADAKLISMEEFGMLVADATGKGPGSPSRNRLEEYDAIRERMLKAEAEAASLRELLKAVIGDDDPRTFDVDEQWQETLAGKDEFDHIEISVYAGTLWGILDSVRGTSWRGPVAPERTEP